MEHCPDHSALMEKIGRIEANTEAVLKMVGNGLSAELQETSKALTAFKADCNLRCALKEKENWFLNILQSSATKVVGYGLVFVMLTALTTSGIWMAVKAYAWKEMPGQQAEIAKQGKEIEAQHVSSQLHNYHQHILVDGRILFHTGNANERAYILDPVTGKFERAPYMRTEESVK